MSRWDGIDEFTAVAEQASFSAAARRLGLSTSAVSREIARLEDRLQTRLLHRTTRRVELTDAGRDFLPILMAIGAWGRKYNGAGALSRHLDAETGEAVRPVVIDANTGAPIGSRPLRFEYPD